MKVKGLLLFIVLPLLLVLEWPKFKGTEFLDLITFIQSKTVKE